MAKISVSIDDDLLAKIRERANGNVSGWLAQTAERQLKSEALLAYADELEAEFGPPSDEVKEKVDSWFSSATPVS